MKVLVDTCVWSLALRRGRDKAASAPHVLELRELIRELRVQVIGPVRQEILTGIRSQAQFKALRNYLRAFPDLELRSSDYERAAELFNILRAKGIQGSNTDLLICAISEQHKFPILTTDADFKLFQKYVPISLHTPRPAMNFPPDQSEREGESNRE